MNQPVQKNTLYVVWVDADTWFERQQQEEEMQRIQAENRATMEAAEELHRKKMAQEREGEKEEETDTKDDPMARAEAEVLKQDKVSGDEWNKERHAAIKKRNKWHSKWPFFPSSSVVQLHDPLSHKRWGLMAISRKKVKESLVQELSGEEGIVVEKKTSRTSRRSPARSRKKVIEDSPEDDFVSMVNADVTDEEINKPPASGEDSKKTRRRTRRKENEVSEMELSDREGDSFIVNVEDEYDEDLELGKDGDEEVSFTYGWPPLVCCFGATQHAFVPSGRPANRLIDYELQERMKDALWTPEKFVRAPGGCASNVAVALAILGGKVALMGKIGDDDYGQSLLYYLNVNNVQTRSMRIDSKRATAASQMKIGKRGGLKMTCVKPCAEDSLSRSEINIDVLKEAKMFYFNTFSMLDRNMRSTMLRAIKISKKLGGIIFYDLNLPLPLWQSCEETKMFIQEVWNLADVIEVTKQELEFLCGIKPSENFDTRDNDRSKFIHYTPEVFGQLWHENLKVLFVTNGTSKIHYYTKEHNSAVLGMEDAPITPFTGDMSASGDGIVAALMRMLTVQPHLITDKGYLEQSVKWHSKWPFFPSSGVVQLHDPLSHKRWGLMAISRKKVKGSLAQELSGEEGIVVEKKTSRTSKRSPARSRKKVIEDSPKDDIVSVVNADVTDEEINKPPASSEDSKKTRRRTQRKAESTSSVLGEEKVEKKITRRGRIKKKVDDTENEVSEMKLSDREGNSFIVNVEDEYDEDLELGKDGDEEVSFTYGWPPLVCCFGATQHAFVPSGRPANRLIDYELQERMKDALWTPGKFVRAPEGYASNVAVALATLGGKVALMGKIGDDDYGQSLLYYLNVNNVQTRSMRIDS
ncbi:hypothetical protein HYC85_015678 [Camellia sinensis]|uniref:Carbohydrate kinase PfkB domain-containing protein n=1 Tax=Camellia sinensis TaxID=4442 RepID=A0A7J7GXQ5_CAMSI|nr:hypothetical protein HYC85_015678 [Camellia sinensis]